MVRESHTIVGTAEIAHPVRVYNPVTEKYENLENMSMDGYKRKFLAYKHKTDSDNVIDMRENDVFSFKKNIWEIDETENHIIVKKK